MLSVGEKHGPPETAFSTTRIQSTDARRGSARRGYAKQACSRLRRKNNDSIFVPRSAAALRRVTDRLHRPTRDLQLFQLRVGKEGDGSSVRRPERIACALGTGQNSGAVRPQFVNPNHVLSRGFLVRDVRDGVPVRRDADVGRGKRERGAEIQAFCWRL